MSTATRHMQPPPATVQPHVQPQKWVTNLHVTTAATALPSPYDKQVARKPKEVHAISYPTPNIPTIHSSRSTTFLAAHTPHSPLNNGQLLRQPKQQQRRQLPRPRPDTQRPHPSECATADGRRANGRRTTQGRLLRQARGQEEHHPLFAVSRRSAGSRRESGRGAFNCFLSLASSLYQAERETAS